MAEYETEEEKARKREKVKAEKKSADDRIAALTREKTATDLKLRESRKAKLDSDKKAKEATLAANKQSSTFAMPGTMYIAAPVAAAVANAAALADGRIGSKENVISWITAAAGLVVTIGAALTDNPTAATGAAFLTATAITSASTPKSREWGKKMRDDAARGAPPGG